MRRALSPVDHHQRAAGVRRPGDLRDRVDRPEGVADVHERHEPGPVGEQPVEVVEDEPSPIVERDVAEARAALLRQELPRHQVAVVLHLGDDHLGREDLVSRPDVPPAPRVRHQVERFGHVPGENDLIRAAGAQKARHLGPGRLVLRGRTLGDRVDPPVDVGVVLLVVAHQRGDDLPRLLRGRRAVQVHQGVSVDALPEDRKVLPDRCRNPHTQLPLLSRRASPACRPSGGGAPPRSAGGPGPPGSRPPPRGPGRPPPTGRPAARAPGRSSR